MANELKPCPFCGGDPEIVTIHDGFTSIGCLKCNPVFGVMVQRRTRKEAVELWNTRTGDQSQAAAYWRRLYEQTVLERTCQNLERTYGEFECSNCGFWADFGNDLQNVKYCPGCGAEVWQ